MTRQAFMPRNAGGAGLPFSTVVQTGPMIAVSGLVGVDPETGVLAGSTIADQTERALQNVAAALDAAGAGMDDVFKTTIFITRAEDFTGMNQVYRRFFREPYPARSTLVVSLVRPEFLVEIEALAWHADHAGASEVTAE